MREGGEKGRGREKKREKIREGGEVTVSKFNVLAKVLL